MGVAVLAVLLRVSLTRSAGMDEHPAPPDAARFAPELMAAAARLYYLQDAAQAEIADRFGTSRPTVSWLLTEARRVDIVRVDIVEPTDGGLDELARPTAALGIWKVWLVPAGTRPARRWRQPCGRPCRPHTCGRGTRCWSPRIGRARGRPGWASRAPPGVIVMPTAGSRDEPQA